MREEEQLDALLERLEILGTTLDVIAKQIEELRHKLETLEKMVKG